MTIYTVNGLALPTSTAGQTGYLGSTFSVIWRKNTPFIAAIVNPTDPDLLELLRSKKSTSLHLGSYDDSRKAAYVAAYYKAHPKEALENLQNNAILDIEFPAELFDLPVFLPLEDAQALIQAYVDAKPKKPRAPFKRDKGDKLIDTIAGAGSGYRTGVSGINNESSVTILDAMEVLYNEHRKTYAEALIEAAEPYKK